MFGDVTGVVVSDMFACSLFGGVIGGCISSLLVGVDCIMTKEFRRDSDLEQMTSS